MKFWQFICLKYFLISDVDNNPSRKSEIHKNNILMLGQGQPEHINNNAGESDKNSNNFSTSKRTSMMSQ